MFNCRTAETKEEFTDKFSGRTKQKLTNSSTRPRINNALLVLKKQICYVFEVG